MSELRRAVVFYSRPAFTPPYALAVYNQYCHYELPNGIKFALRAEPVNAYSLEAAANSAFPRPDEKVMCCIWAPPVMEERKRSTDAAYEKNKRWCEERQHEHKQPIQQEMFAAEDIVALRKNDERMTVHLNQLLRRVYTMEQTLCEQIDVISKLRAEMAKKGSPRRKSAAKQ